MFPTPLHPMSSQEDLPTTSNITQPLSSPEDRALQELWARLIAGTGDQSLMTSRPKTSGGSSAKDLPGDHGQAFIFQPDGKRRSYPTMSTGAFKAALFDSFQSSTPDWGMLHLLRANSFSIDRTLQDAYFHISWRKLTMRVDEELLPQGEPGALRVTRDPSASKKDRLEAEGFLRVLRQGTAQILRGLDVHNRIIVLIRLRLHRGYVYPGKTYLNLAVYFCECCRLQMADKIDETVLMIDFGEAGFQNLDDRPFRHIVEVIRDIYPQGLGDLIMHRMPKTLAPFWKVTKRLMRPEFVSHIHFTKNVEDLERFIPRERIPAELGGGDDFQWVYEEPDLDDPMNGGGGDAIQLERDEKRQALMAERTQLGDAFLAATKRWIEDARNGRDAADAKAARERTMQALMVNYWKLDPYIRARSIFDKFGWLPQPLEDMPTKRR